MGNTDSKPPPNNIKEFKFFRKCYNEMKNVIFSGIYPIGNNSIINIQKESKEDLNVKVLLLKDSSTNIKITVKMDIDKAELLFLSHRWKNGENTYVYRPWKTNVIYMYPWNILGDSNGPYTETNALGDFKEDHNINIILCEECEYEIVIPSDSKYEFINLDLSKEVIIQ